MLRPPEMLGLFFVLFLAMAVAYGMQQDWPSVVFSAGGAAISGVGAVVCWRAGD